MENKIKKAVFAFIFTCILCSGIITTANASRGNWKSASQSGLTGWSKVTTTYTGGAGQTTQATLAVKFDWGENVSSRVDAYKTNQRVEHQAFSLRSTRKYGTVTINKNAYHLPTFTNRIAGI